MRVLLFAVGLFAANVVVEAGVCKPAHTTASHSDAVLSIESSATSASTTLTETLGLSTTETVSLESTETSASGSTLATTTTEILSTSVTEAPSATTTAEASTTVSSSTGPVATPGSIVGTGPVAGITLQGDDTRFVALSFGPQTLIFNLVNGKLATGSNNNYLCLSYRDTDVLGPLVLCPFDNFTNAPLNCQQSTDGTLACTAPNGSCTSTGTCRRPNNGAPYSQFYVNDAQEGFFGPASGDFTGYTAINPVLVN
ncbi:hypothetical protein FPOAC2_00029 [Fusarium poae]|uniref:Ubiquitin 3 binding protein But2 C-terminal domain-containing protein n=1 Tax=Fusarium poae TaxID=36050 RepID=D2JLZ5_FUSPO|nr:hypothetical protein FPOAC1_000018 [Fusarium poae]ACZ63282.1 hypothetical protein FPOAE_0002 [Fusarium poae]KAG8674055.1 hypothetical protein FPOAC1_000018 [Fusarium poae]OBS26076.1 hypothetical protein FPOA_00020 [Fusarium poae]